MCLTFTSALGSDFNFTGVSFLNGTSGEHSGFVVSRCLLGPGLKLKETIFGVHHDVLSEAIERVVLIVQSNEMWVTISPPYKEITSSVAVLFL